MAPRSSKSKSKSVASSRGGSEPTPPPITPTDSGAVSLDAIDLQIAALVEQREAAKQRQEAQERQRRKAEKKAREEAERVAAEEAARKAAEEEAKKAEEDRVRKAREEEKERKRAAARRPAAATEVAEGPGPAEAGTSKRKRSPESVAQDKPTLGARK